MSLQFAEGNETIRQEIRTNPYNLMATYIADYSDCLLLLFNGNEADYKQLHQHLEERQQLLNRGDPSSQWYRLCKGGIYMHWAFVYLRLGEDFKAANAFRKSYGLLKENRNKFPSFEYNDIFYGLEEASVGAIPDDYKWIAAIFGMRGSVNSGMAKLENFVNKHNANDPLYDDALIFYAYLKFYLLSEHEQVWQFVNSSKFPAANNLLFSFVKANIALNYRKADAALATVKSVQAVKNYNQFPVFDYEMGNALLHKLDQSATGHFNNFLKEYKGEFFIKDTWQKLSLLYYLQGNMDKARECRTKIAKIGTAKVDADRKAKRFAEQSSWPPVVILQASLLADGGFYSQALSRLLSRKEADFAEIADKAEYNFRLGRVYDELGDDAKALQYYNNAIAIGKERKEHFAARAALQCGMMYERRNQSQLAIASYKACLDMPVQDFKNSIKQQAKAGINRLTVK
jgi:tetratricopeptide (TPR) repeat protein